MKKIFALLMVLMGSMAIVRATEITVPATTLDLQNPTMVREADWFSGDVYFMNDDVLVVSGYESYKSITTQTWITFSGVGGYSGFWAQARPFRGSDFYIRQSYVTLQEGRYIAYLVTNCDSVMAYGYNNAASKYLVMNIYDVTGSVPATIDDAVVSATFAVNNSVAGGENAGIMKQALEASKTYLVVVCATGNSNSRLYEVAFFRHHSEEGIEETLAEGKAVKVLRDGQVLILRGDKTFNLTGQRMP